MREPRSTVAAACTVLALAGCGGTPATPFAAPVRQSAAPAGPHGPGTAPVDLERSTKALDGSLAAAVRTAPLARLLGRSHLRVRERGRGPGVTTVLADVIPPRREVGAVLPQPDARAPARMHARVLRDLLLDVRDGHLLAVQPGPASRVSEWRPGAPRAPTAPDTRRPPRLLPLIAGGPAFVTDDGPQTLRARHPDWPVSLVFTGRATVERVKRGLRAVGLTHRGGVRWLGYRLPGERRVRFDGDRGLKGACDADATDVHVRLYAPPRASRFAVSGLGAVVLGTAHLDHVDGCGTGPPLFGFSERAERQVATLLATRLGWRVRLDGLPLGNAEPLRRDPRDPAHIALGDGAATVVAVP